MFRRRPLPGGPRRCAVSAVRSHPPLVGRSGTRLTVGLASGHGSSAQIATAAVAAAAAAVAAALAVAEGREEGDGGGGRRDVPGRPSRGKRPVTTERIESPHALPRAPSAPPGRPTLPDADSFDNALPHVTTSAYLIPPALTGLLQL